MEENNMEFILRKWEMDDIESVAKYANDMAIAKNLRDGFPNPYTLEAAKSFVTSCIEKGDSQQYLRAIVVDGKAVGSVGVFIGNDVYGKTGELGYWLAKDYWRQGIMSRAVKEIVKEVFDKYDIVRIYAEPFEPNKGSQGVLEKVGFTYEGTMRNGVCKYGEIFGYCMYSILREEVYVSLNQ